LHIIPIAVSISTADVVVYQNIIRTSQPEGTRSLISIQETVRCFCQNRQVTVIDTLRLNTIFNEERVTHSVVSNILLDSEVMDSVSCHSTIVGVMDRITLDKRSMHSTDHMEVNGISPKLEGLTCLCALDVVNPSD
jgi:hypothetical protein